MGSRATNEKHSGRRRNRKPHFSGRRLVDRVGLMGMLLRGTTLCLLIVWCASGAGNDVYTSLRQYEGSWRVTMANALAGEKPEDLKNDCAVVGKFFACQQTVNGTPGDLLIIMPVANQPGHYRTQHVTQEGRASGIGQLEISGQQWIFSTRWDQGSGKTTYYKTTNTFTGRNRIHFEQAESSNDKDWTVKNSGDEVRVSGVGR